MKCDFDITLISGHLDGENTKAEDERLSAHIKTCDECRTLLEMMRKNDTRLKEMTAQPPLDLTNRIMQQVRKHPKKSKKPFYISVAASGVAVAAMLGLVISGGVKMPTDDAAAEIAGVLESHADDTNETLLRTNAVDDTQESPVDYYYVGENEIDEHFSTLAPDMYVYASTPEDEKRVQISETAILVIRTDASKIAVKGERVFLTKNHKLLQNTEYKITGDETAAYIVPWETLLEIASEYKGMFEMEEYYALDAQYLNAVIIFAE